MVPSLRVLDKRTYCDWIVRYIKFHGGTKHPRDMGKSKIEAFLSDLALHGNVAAATKRISGSGLLS